MFKKLVYAIFIPLPVMLTTTGCMVRDYFREKNRQIDYLERSNKQIEMQLSLLDSLAREQKEFLVSMRTESATKLKELESRASAVESKLNDLESLLYRKSRGVITQPPTSEDTTRKLESIYNTAYADFIKGNYELAIAGFRQFLAEFENVDNAYYWIGESYYAMGNYGEAAAVFKHIAENYPKSKKAPPSLYKLITIYALENDTLHLQECRKKLIERYPDSPEAKLVEKVIPAQE